MKLDMIMAKKTTLRDIAKHANVALSTVSQVLNNKPGVSPELRHKIIESATQLGYQQKITVDAPLVSNLSTIGLLVKRDEDTPIRINAFYSYVIAGAERECQRLNISMMFANLEVDPNNRIRTMPPMLIDQRVDGLIVLGAFLEETIAEFGHLADQNLVLVDAYATNSRQFDSVLTDNIDGAMNAVNYLIENGHCHIGLIGSNPDSYPSIFERRQAYIKVLETHNIDHIYIEDGQLNREDAYRATLRLLERAPQLTAIFACNDNVASGVINALQDKGLNVPADVSVIGFDDIDLAQEVIPPLTTIHVDKVLMGALAVRHLRDRVEFPMRPTLKTYLSTHLVKRDSVRQL